MATARTLDLHDLDESIRTLVSECEVSGRQTVFEREGRGVAVLVSYDEYLALLETVSIAERADLVQQIGEAEEQARAGDLLDAEDLLVE